MTQTTKTNQGLSRISQWTDTDVEMLQVIKDQVLKNATDVELAYFAKVAQQTGLDPLQKEIWGYKDHMGNLIIFAGRDGFLKSAQRSKEFSGIDSSEVRENDEFTVDMTTRSVHHKITELSVEKRGKIRGAWCKVYRKRGEDVIETLEVVDIEPYDKGHNTWKSNPAAMIRKVAESHALKRAFGISGLQIQDNWEITNDEAVAIHTEPKSMQGITSEERGHIIQLLESSSLDHDEVGDLIAEVSVDDITRERFESILLRAENNQLDAFERPNYRPGMNEVADKVKEIAG